MPSEHARPVALEAADGLVGIGAEAVVLGGSHVVGPRELSFRLEHRGGLLVSVTSRPSEAYRTQLENPVSVYAAVQRSVLLAVRLAGVMAVRRRILFGS